MIARYRVLAERLRAEVQTLEQVVARAEGAADRAGQHPQDQEYFLAAAALDLHGFYAGIERLIEQIANEVDGGQPTGRHWRRDLLAQMALAVPDVRPAVLASETSAALDDYLGFRHVVRNVYTFNLRPERVAELVRGLRPAFDLARRDLLGFATFLDGLATADEMPATPIPTIKNALCDARSDLLKPIRDRLLDRHRTPHGPGGCEGGLVELGADGGGDAIIFGIVNRPWEA